MSSYNEDMEKMPHQTETLERATVYLTPQNKRRLAALRRGEKTKHLNQALNASFAETETKPGFSEVLEAIAQFEPVKPIMGSSETLRLLRSGLDHKVADMRGSNSS